MTLFSDLVTWLRDLDPAFAFLLSLPFLVGLAGLISERHQRDHGAPDRTER